MAFLAAASWAHAYQFTWDDLPSASAPGGALTPSGVSYMFHDDFVSADLGGGADALSGSGAANGSLVYAVGPLTITVTGFYFDGSTAEGATVVHDHGNAGLGVYHLDDDTSDDNVTGNTSDGTLETLMLSFNLPVTLSGLTFRDSGHNSLTSDTYLFNGGSGVFGTDPSPVSGTVFTFAYGGDDPNQFYLSALEATVTTPDGGMTAILLGLSFLGMGAFSRRARG